MRPRHRMPSFAESLAPRDERKPRLAAESDRDQMPVWLLGRVDFDCPWCWKRMDADTLHRVHERLCAFERMTFKEIDDKRNHEIPVERLGKAARDRLVELGIDEYDEVLSLRVPGPSGFGASRRRTGSTCSGGDPAHTVYPMNIRDN